MKKKILIVEDEEMLQKVLSEQFEKAGFEVSVASDGEKALESLKGSLPDLVLLDIILPKINGFDVLKAIKENSNTKDIPVIMISNLGQDADIKQAIKLGAADYYIKAQHPIFEIIEKVDKFLSIPRSPLVKSKEIIKEKKAVEKVPEKSVEKVVEMPIEKIIEKPIEEKLSEAVVAIIEKPFEKIVEKPIEKSAEVISEKMVEEVVIEKPAEKIIEKPKKTVKKPIEEAGELIGKIIGIAKESAKDVAKKQVEKAAGKKPKIIERIKLAEEKKPIEKKIKKEEKYPQLPKSARKFIRMKKAELGKMELEPEKYEEEVAKLYQTFSPNKKTESSI